jgi:excisionase family DNA binding protein
MTKNLNYLSDISVYKTITDAEDASALFFNKLIWGIDEVCSFTRYSKGTIYNLVSEGDIPYRKKRGRLWFVPNEILKWIKGELQ